MAELILWVSLALCAYTYIGYPLVLKVMAALFARGVRKGSGEPGVSFIIAGYNEEAVVAAKLENTLGLEYPSDRLQVIFASDGSTDSTVRIARRFEGKGVVVLHNEGRRGKVSALNDAVCAAKGEILVFSDCRQRFDPLAVRALVENFNDPAVGAVSGELFIGTNGDGRAPTASYWDYEKSVRKSEAAFGSVMGVTGAIWAIRRSIFEPYPQATILDDLYQPMRAVLKGYRVVFESGARAFDVASKKTKDEIRRKVRTIAGNWQVFFSMKGLFDPWQNRAIFQFVSHKVLRLLVPFFLLIAFTANIFALDQFSYRILFYSQLLFYGVCLASVGAAKIGFRSGLISLFHVFTVLNYSAVAGFVNFITGRQGVIWKN
ncbi:MAG: glycosyltransferase family 2 protein [Deltaproteobacteria bacterium]